MIGPGAEGSDTSGGVIKSATGLLRPGGTTLRFFGITGLVALVATVIVLLFIGALQSRDNYFERRNLRELDRIAEEINSTKASLASVSSLHFVPSQLNFAMTPDSGCLIARTRIKSAAGTVIDIAYQFVDPEGLARLADRAVRTPDASLTGAVIAEPSYPANRCTYRRSPARPLPAEKVAISDGRYRVEKIVLLQTLLRPMVNETTDRRLVNPADCGGRTALGSESSSIAVEIMTLCFAEAAARDMGLAPRGQSPGDDDVRSRIEQSVGAAAGSNAIHVTASIDTEALNLETALDTFDAIQIVGDRAGGAAPTRALLLQAGEVPPAIEEDERLDQKRALQQLLSAGTSRDGANEDRAQDRSRLRGAAGPGGTRDNLLVESAVDRAGDLVIFEKEYASLGGLNCSSEPCRLAGIIAEERFGRGVRRIDGLLATGFLIGVLTLIGLLPLVHLALRKRLDPIRWTAQYVMWFSLSLLAATAMIASLTIWSTMASRAVGERYATERVADIRAAFDVELKNGLALISWAGAHLGPNDQLFPAPLTLPDPAQASRDPAVRKGPRPLAGGPAWLNLLVDEERRPARPIVESVTFYREDGLAARNAQRIAMGGLPSFGANIADRSYFQRALDGDFSAVEMPLAHCGGRSAEVEFVIDRIFARPDGVARTVLGLPFGRDCVGAAMAARNAAAGAAAESPAILITTAAFRTFLQLQLKPGFSYAVIDASRPEGEVDILFHSRERAELVERFDRDVDGQDAFRALVDAVRSRDRSRSHEAPLTLDTRYRAEPVRLSLAPLHDNLDWVLILIEDRNDAGFAAWRAATFGYLAWLGATLVVLAVTVLGRLRNDKGLDRRPGMWLWPAAVLTDFTPPRFERESRRLADLRLAAHARDRAVTLVLAGGVAGVLAAEGISRSLFALGATLAALSVRAHFRGRTATDAAAAQSLDRYSIVGAVAFLAPAFIVFGPSLIADQGEQGKVGALLARTAVFTVASLMLALALLRAWQSSSSPVIRRPLPRKPRRWRFRPDPGRSKRGFNTAWMAVLMAMGAVPAAAGYLDSSDYDWFLVEERQRIEQAKGAAEVQRRFEALDMSRLVGVLDVPQARPDAGASAPTSVPHLSMARALTGYFGWHALALEYSDLPGFHMREGFSGGVGAILHSLALIALPIALLLAALLYFRRHYFKPAPRISWGRDLKFDPPLSPTREKFLRDMLYEAATGGTVKPPFEPLPGTRHLILGVDLDIRDDPALRDVRDGIEWIDLLKVAVGDEGQAAAVGGGAASARADGETEQEEPKKAIVIGNLDIALQLPGKRQAQAVFKAIENILGVTPDRKSEERHVFLLADVEPLDRIALLRDRSDGADSLSQAEEWRWAALLQDFVLYPIAPDVPDPAAGASAVGRELSVLSTSFAKSLLEKLPDALKQPALDTADEERAITYITEQQGDYYHRLWASSSDEERVMLYHIAWKRHLKMGESRALRSLLTRGLVVRNPEYRLMNRSFARYIRRVERPALIRRRAEGTSGTDQVWPLIRYPLAVLVAALLIMLQFVSPESTTGAVGLLPAIGAVVPTLFANWLRQRTSTA